MVFHDMKKFFTCTTVDILSHAVAHPGNDNNEGDLVTVMKGATTTVNPDRLDRLTYRPVLHHTNIVTEHMPGKLVK